MKSSRQNFYHIHSSLWKRLSSKKYLLDICKIFQLLVITFTADDKYSLLSRETQNQCRCNYLRKTKIFLNIFLCFWNLDEILNIFKKKTMTIIAYVFPKLQTAKDAVREVSKKSRFRRNFDKLHGKRSKSLLKSEGQDLYRIYWWLWTQLSWKKTLIGKT